MKINKKRFPLSIPQRILLSSQLYTVEPNRVFNFNVLNWYYTIKGDYDIACIEKAYNRLIMENDALRTRFVVSAGGLRQYIDDFQYEHIEICHTDKTGLTEEDLAEYLPKIQLPRIIKGQQHRAMLLTYCGGAVLLVRFGHYCFDGFSLGLAVSYLTEYYETLLRGEKLGDLDKKRSIESYLEENSKYRESDKHREHVKYWKDAFKEHKSFCLPIPRRKLNGDATGIKILIDGEKYRKLTEYAKSVNLPVSFIANNVIALTIAKLTNKKEFALANIVHGRSKFVRKQQIGCMMNTFLMFYTIDSEEKINDFFQNKYMEYLDSFKNGTITPVECLLASWKTAIKCMDPNYYGIMISTLDFSAANIDREKYGFGLIRHQNLPHQLYCCIEEDSEIGLTLVLNYQIRRFSKTDIDKITKAYLDIMDSVIDSQNDKIGDLM